MPAHAVREARVADTPQVSRDAPKRALIIATWAGLLMAYVGAFGTDRLPLLARFAYWLILMESGALIGIGASTGVRTWGRLASKPFLEGAAVSLLIALPLTLVASGTTILFFGQQAFGGMAVALLFVAVFVITAAVTTIVYITGRTGTAISPLTISASDEQPTDDTHVATPSVDNIPLRLAGRLSPHLRSAKILALEAEDHYVRVHTENGSELLLMRLGDAVDELDGMTGERTHRSWWVSRQAVASSWKGDGRAELTLANAIVVPVSRSALSSLRNQGWFADNMTE